MEKHFIVKTIPKAKKENIIKGENYRITVLTPELVRMEYSKDGKFEDRSTQMIWNRDFPKTDFKVVRKKNKLVLETEKIILEYNEKAFSKKGLSITLKNNIYLQKSVWHYGDDVSNLLGTARTLDNINGSCVEMGQGIMSKDGFSVIEDNTNIVLKDDGWIEERRRNETDLYIFCYGRDYIKALKDFYHLTSATPLIPRYALGNWWSRYYKYTQQEYIELMDTFKEKDIPLSVAVIDMDWHITEVDPKYGSGWTGWTWNEKLFPDHVAFLKELHNRGLKTTLNIHPHSGVRAFEKPYPVIGKHMGVDVENGEQVFLDVTNEKFMKYFYEDVLNPLEDEGVDFFWTDWQQGSKTKIDRLDPLWMFNHFNYMDSGRKGNRNITFSRYAEVGSHRYPIGFSGDTFVTWETLDFQPYFTANAANVGYGWWSHDIGGHMRGYKDNELMTRWVQFAVFSPILRLHSTCNKFNGKEPWRYGYEAERIISDSLRLRHRLIPYLYNMNYRAYSQGLPICLPLYYLEPYAPEAYTHKNEYYFGSDLLVCPITSPRISNLGLSKVNAYLPEGKWIDVFENRIYTGARELDLYRGLDKIPVFAKAGSIIPTTDILDAKSVAKNPKQLHIYIFMGDNGACEMYEDDGNTNDYLDKKYVKTQIKLHAKDGAKSSLTIEIPKGELSLLPKTRDYVFEFRFSKDMVGKTEVRVGGEQISNYSHTYNDDTRCNVISLKNISTKEKVEITFDSCANRLENNLRKDVFDFIDNAEMPFELKERVFNAVFSNKCYSEMFRELSKLSNNYDFICALLDIINSDKNDTSYLVKE